MLLIDICVIFVWYFCPFRDISYRTLPKGGMLWALQWLWPKAVHALVGVSLLSQRCDSRVSLMRHSPLSAETLASQQWDATLSAVRHVLPTGHKYHANIMQISCKYHTSITQISHKYHANITRQHTDQHINCKHLWYLWYLFSGNFCSWQ